ncbi:cadherin domain-containing protein, partial [Ensifer sp. 22564]|uniref:calcium-binding protein n=1 Tax=Ensifer sp. 22564 TaxID=3453943 RepID=UPI003F87D9E9
DAATGVVTFKAAPDFEAPADADGDNVYDIVVTASDGTLATDRAVAITVTNVNDNAPVFSSGATASFAENGTGVVYDADASDADNLGALSYSLSGTDSALFDIDAATGVVTFKAAPDFETPADVDGDNVYDIVVTASDVTLTTDRAVAITVTNQNENGSPSITSNGGAETVQISVPENTTAVTTITATDPDAGDTLTYTVVAGADYALFQIDALTGVLRFKAAPDYEMPADQNGDNVYEVVVQVSDGALHDSQAISVAVTDVIGVTVSGSASKGDALTGTGEGDTLNGLGGNDTLSGLAGNDLLDGGAGKDTLVGGTGNDTFVVDNTGDVVSENPNEGVDTIRSSITYTLGAYVENLQLTGSTNINGTGNELDNVIVGNSGNNALFGMAGADVLDGQEGIDTASYVASSSAVNVSLAAGTAIGGDAQGDSLISIENLIGSAFDDVLEGNSGDNQLTGGAGLDTITYQHAVSGVTINLAATVAQNTVGAGMDTLFSFENLTGSALSDQLAGNAGSNVLNGLDGDDVLIGGGGGDTLFGGSGRDRFVLNEVADSLSSASDIIRDFLHGVDQIDLRLIDANISGKAKGDQAFAFAGQNAGVVANSVTWHETTIDGSSFTTIQADVDGKGGADLVIQLTGTGLNLTASDFWL